MKLRITLIVLFLSLFTYRGWTQEEPTSDYHGYTDDEFALFQLLNQYRVEHGFPELLFSKNLSFVARMHAADLNKNRPDLSGCNLHSWSNKGPWSACCYSNAENRSKCMEGKPAELSRYEDKAFEMVYSAPAAGKRIATDAYYYFTGIPVLNDYLTEKGKWVNFKWASIGVGIEGKFVTVWLGEEEDRDKFNPQVVIPVVAEKKEVVPEVEVEEQIAVTEQTEETAVEEVKEAVEEVQEVAEEVNVEEAEKEQKKTETREVEAEIPVIKADSLKAMENKPELVLVLDTTSGRRVLQAIPVEEEKPVAETEPAQPVKQEAVTPAAPTGPFYVIVGSLRNRDMAELEVARLKRIGHDYAMIVPGENAFRIAVGKFASEAEAKRALEKVVDKFPTAWVLKPE